MSGFLVYELICVVIFVLLLIINKRFNLYILLFITLFFLLTYIILPLFDIRLTIHRYMLRGIATVVAGAIAYGVYLIDLKRRK